MANRHLWWIPLQHPTADDTFKKIDDTHTLDYTIYAVLAVWKRHWDGISRCLMIHKLLVLWEVDTVSILVSQGHGESWFQVQICDECWSWSNTIYIARYLYQASTVRWQGFEHVEDDCSTWDGSINCWRIQWITLNAAYSMKAFKCIISPLSATIESNDNHIFLIISPLKRHLLSIQHIKNINNTQQQRRKHVVSSNRTCTWTLVPSYIFYPWATFLIHQLPQMVPALIVSYASFVDTTILVRMMFPAPTPFQLVIISGHATFLATPTQTFSIGEGVLLCNVLNSIL